ncbi:MAG: site-2 protease family protein [Chloroflexi bacterium]|nr:site-2 protease family protein [Chloroflexota bacterium]
MILQSLDLLRDNPVSFLLVIGIGLAGLIVGFTVHEFSHAFTAHMQGDDTARRMGRLTFNPLKHIDLLGFLLLLVVGFGWAKPVQVDPYNLRGGRLGMSLVAFAGPLSNFILAFALGLVFRFDLVPVVLDTRGISGVEEILGFAAFLAIFFNIILGIFNLIPLPPLDGSKVLGGLLPRALYEPYLRFERYGWIPLIALVGVNLFLSYAFDYSFLGQILLPPALFVFRLATGVG